MTTAHPLPIAPGSLEIKNYDRCFLISNLNRKLSTHPTFKSITMRTNEKRFAHISRTFRKVTLWLPASRRFRLSHHDSTYGTSVLRHHVHPVNVPRRNNG